DVTGGGLANPRARAIPDGLHATVARSTWTPGAPPHDGTEPARTTGGPDRDTQNPARGRPGPG
ncbi:hypothetical protein, partial [Streptomyces parvus]|uniref:hypothetical protein n=1 Tax=Streptomyces parvus TaxID=66428 RepID=UPI00363D553A